MTLRSIDSAAYEERAKAVYWHGAEACRKDGPQNAECLLEVGHDGPHQGNGYDSLGPLSRSWPQ